jgi:hypothetical protein
VREELPGLLYISWKIRPMLPIVDKQVNVVELGAKGCRKLDILQGDSGEFIFVDGRAESQVFVGGFQIRDYFGDHGGGLHKRNLGQRAVLVHKIVDAHFGEEILWLVDVTPHSARPQTMEEVYALLRGAAARKLPMAAIDNGLPRLLCPHVLGRNREGRLRALCYQFGGESGSGLQMAPEGMGGWRCIAVDKLSQVALRAGAWHTEPRFESDSSQKYWLPSRVEATFGTDAL